MTFPFVSIRLKLSAAFSAVALVIAGFVIGALNMELQTVERAALLEAEHLAGIVAYAGADNALSTAEYLQSYVDREHALSGRDLVFVDANQKGIADSSRHEIGDVFNHDPGDEVGQTIRDGRVRTFVEQNGEHPQGIKQIVVPLHAVLGKSGSPIVGAAIFEYSHIYDGLLAAEKNSLYLLGSFGIGCVLLAMIFGLRVAAKMAGRIKSLQEGVDIVAAGDYGTNVPITSQDELGRLGRSFNTMAVALKSSRDQLEERVASRTKDLEYLAYFDALTGLANRRLYHERLGQFLSLAGPAGRKVAVLVIDFERFRSINQTLGRQAGDELLKQFAERAERHIRKNWLARIGADQFASIVPDMHSVDVVRRIEQRLMEVLSEPFKVGGAEVRVSVKIGIALFPDDGTDSEMLLRNAEAALKKAKAAGERYLFYTQEMTARVAEKLTLENQLRRALDKGEFVLHYQPKVDLESGLLTSAEALIRWNDPRTGLVPPGKFIPVLEETGLILDVGRWALRQAIADYLRWRRAGLPAVRIAVNVSPLQLRNRGFTAEVGQAVGVDPQAAAGLELEITESLIMEDVERNIASLRAIRAMGVTIAIDDFGTGFSSLSYLAKLPIDTLKIDRSFVIDMMGGPDGLALVSTIINLAHSMKLKVVAEGVETQEQSHLLRLLRCNEMQGFLFSKAVPAETFETRFLAPAPRPEAEPA